MLLLPVSVFLSPCCPHFPIGRSSRGVVFYKSSLLHIKYSLIHTHNKSISQGQNCKSFKRFENSKPSFYCSLHKQHKVNVMLVPPLQRDLSIRPQSEPYITVFNPCDLLSRHNAKLQLLCVCVFFSLTQDIWSTP